MLELVPSDDPAQALRTQGLCLLDPDQLTPALGLATNWAHEWDALSGAWGRLPADSHLRDGGHYRRRRHSCFVQDLQMDTLQIQAHRPHWQPVDYNALHGGFERWFEPIEASLCEAPAWQALLLAVGRLLARARPTPQWFIEAHTFRIDTTGGVGRPTPEGAHRDGVDFVLVMLVGRRGIKGGESRVFEAEGAHGLRFMMEHPRTTLLIDDTRVIHETTPVQPLGPALGVRDTLVLTYRSGGFQAAQ